MSSSKDTTKSPASSNSIGLKEPSAIPTNVPFTKHPCSKSQSASTASNTVLTDVKLQLKLQLSRVLATSVPPNHKERPEGKAARFKINSRNSASSASSSLLKFIPLARSHNQAWCLSTRATV